MPVPNVRLSKSQVDALVSTCDLGEATLLRIGKALDSEQAQLIKPARLREIIAREIDNERVARTIARFLISLATLRRRSFATAAELLDGISEGLPTTSPSWDKAQLERWTKCRPALHKLLESKLIILAAKALDLTFDFSEFCIGARILTDIRPIFDDPKDTIIGAAISQTLRLEYAGRNGEISSISIALDLDDILHLKNACEEALHKGEVAKRLVEDKCNISTITATEYE
jgi:hypothetical protein